MSATDEVPRELVFDANGDPLPIQHVEDGPGLCPVCDARLAAWQAWLDSDDE